MMWRSAGKLALTVSVGLLLTLSTLPATAAGGHGLAAAGPRHLDWRPCADATGFDCATLRVPADWQHPGSPPVALAVVRHKATDPARRIGSLVMNPGGPGGSGVEAVQEGSMDFSADLLARFDVVGWDPRGVGQSQPVVCDAGLLNTPVSRYPTTRGEFTALVRYNEALRRSCRADTGPMFDHLDSASTARDLDALRAALGEKQLTYFGFSYGTLIGEQYAELFPGRVRAMALDSNEDHSVGALAWVTALSRAQEQSYDQFASWCRRATACPLHPRDALAVLDRLYARAQQGTSWVPGHPDEIITPEVLLDFIRGELGGVARWQELAQNLLAVLNEPVPTGARSSGVATQAAVSSEEATKTAIFCEDHQWDTTSLADLGDLRRAMAATAPHTHMSTTGFKDVTGCLGWPHPVVNPQHRLVVHGAAPILMVNSRYDVATPYAGALRATAQIGRSAVLLTYDGTSHVDYEETDCVRSAVDRYLTTLATPDPRVHCPAVFPS